MSYCFTWSDLQRLGEEAHIGVPGEETWKHFWGRFSRLCIGYSIGIFTAEDLAQALAVNGKEPSEFQSAPPKEQAGLLMADFVVVQWLKALPDKALDELSGHSRMTTWSLAKGYFQGWEGEGEEAPVTVDPRALEDRVPVNHEIHKTWTKLEVMRLFMSLGDELRELSFKYKNEIVMALRTAHKKLEEDQRKSL